MDRWCCYSVHLETEYGLFLINCAAAIMGSITRGKPASSLLTARIPLVAPIVVSARCCTNPTGKTHSSPCKLYIALQLSFENSNVLCTLISSWVISFFLYSKCATQRTVLCSVSLLKLIWLLICISPSGHLFVRVANCNWLRSTSRN